MSLFGKLLLGRSKPVYGFSEMQLFNESGILRRWRTIYALSSGSLPSAIAVVRISGDQSEATLKLLTRKIKLETSRIIYTNIYDKNGRLLDRSMACFFKGPKTFTGEDSAELYLHGSRAVVNAVFATLAEIPGLESAKAGEFTKRAFFNGKMDVHEVEALSDLIHSETDSQRLLSLQQAERGRYLVPIRDHLVDLLAELEASIDFSDEESVSFINAAAMSRKGAEILRQLKSMRVAAVRGYLIRSGVHVALVGRTNVGKSSLMNKLAEKDVSIVSDIPGTTRDSLNLQLQLKSMLVNFTDTAGIRDTDDPLEIEGIRRSIKRTEEANLIILVVDKHVVEEILQEIRFLLQRLHFDADRQQLIVCLNKADLAPREIISTELMNALQKSLSINIIVVCTSCRDTSNIGLKELIEKLELLIDGDEAINPDGDGNEVVLSSNRHIELLEGAVLEMEGFLAVMPKDDNDQHYNDDPALAAEHLRRCAEMVGEIAGTIVNDQVLDRLFAKFCIGK